MSQRCLTDILIPRKHHHKGVSLKRHHMGRPPVIYKTQIVKRIREYFLLNPNPTLLELADFLGISPLTLERYIKRFSPLREAIRQGGLPFDIQVANSLGKRAVGYDVVEKKIVKKIVVIEGQQQEQIEEVIESIRHIPPNVEAQKYWLSKRNKNWQDQDESEKFKKDMETIAELLGVSQEELPE